LTFRGDVEGAGELCAPFGHLPYGSVNTWLPTSLRCVQIAFGGFGNPGNVSYVCFDYGWRPSTLTFPASKTYLLKKLGQDL